MPEYVTVGWQGAGNVAGRGPAGACMGLGWREMSQSTLCCSYRRTEDGSSVRCRVDQPRDQAK
jgi:hypothetical protein